MDIHWILQLFLQSLCLSLLKTSAVFGASMSEENYMERECHVRAMSTLVCPRARGSCWGSESLASESRRLSPSREQAHLWPEQPPSIIGGPLFTYHESSTKWNVCFGDCLSDLNAQLEESQRLQLGVPDFTLGARRMQGKSHAVSMFQLSSSKKKRMFPKASIQKKKVLQSEVPLY